MYIYKYNQLNYQLYSVEFSTKTSKTLPKDWHIVILKATEVIVWDLPTPGMASSFHPGIGWSRNRRSWKVRTSGPSGPLPPLGLPDLSDFVSGTDSNWGPSSPVPYLSCCWGKQHHYHWAPQSAEREILQSTRQCWTTKKEHPTPRPISVLPQLPTTDLVPVLPAAHLHFASQGTVPSQPSERSPSEPSGGQEWTACAEEPCWMPRGCQGVT